MLLLPSEKELSKESVDGSCWPMIESIFRKNEAPLLDSVLISSSESSQWRRTTKTRRRKDLNLVKYFTTLALLHWFVLLPQSTFSFHLPDWKNCDKINKYHHYRRTQTPTRGTSCLVAAAKSSSSSSSSPEDIQYQTPSSFQKPLSTSNITYLSNIDRVLVLSDLHTDHVDNLAWLANRTSMGDLSSSDLIIVAGDISHDLERLDESLALLLETGASVFFVAGNHEAWLSSAQLKKADATTSASASSVTSVDKLERVYQHCHRMGVLTGCTVVGGKDSRPFPLFILPLESWYDGSLAIQECHDLVHDFPKWPWVDFMRCRWPFPHSNGRLLRKIPSGLVEFFAEYNRGAIRQLERSLLSSFENSKQRTGIMTVSHFLPNQQCLPDWKDISSKQFLKDSWLNHGGGGVSAKFALVAGTQQLESQIRSIAVADDDDVTFVRRIHIFGHSHRPKDFELDNVRYIHNPLGKPREREIFMVNPDVDFQHVWDTRTGEVEGETVIRYWEEKGGGVEMLRSRMKKSKRKSRYVFSQKGKTRSELQQEKESAASVPSGTNVTVSSSSRKKR
jgi:predicted phosphodiesterase